MSYEATVWAWKQPLKTASLKILLLHLADSANPGKGNETWYSFAGIAKRCGMSKSVVAKNMRILEELEYVTLVAQGRGVGKTNRYRLNVGSVEVQIGPKIPLDSHSGQDSPEPHSAQLVAHSGQLEPHSGHNRSLCDDKPVTESVNEPVIETLPAAPPPKTGEGKSTAVWKSYYRAYMEKYKSEPLRGKSVNSMLCKLVDLLGVEKACHIAEFYLTVNNRLYTEASHPVNLMLRDAQALHTGWNTGKRMTSTHAQQIDRTQTNFSNMESVIAKRKAEGKM